MTKDIEEYCKSPISTVRKETFKSFGSPLETAQRDMKMYKYISRGTPKDCEKLKEFLLSTPDMYLCVLESYLLGTFMGLKITEVYKIKGMVMV